MLTFLNNSLNFLFIADHLIFSRILTITILKDYLNQWCINKDFRWITITVGLNHEINNIGLSHDNHIIKFMYITCFILLIVFQYFWLALAFFLWVSTLVCSNLIIAFFVVLTQFFSYFPPLIVYMSFHTAHSDLFISWFDCLAMIAFICIFSHCSHSKILSPSYLISFGNSWLSLYHFKCRSLLQSILINNIPCTSDLKFE